VLERENGLEVSCEHSLVYVLLHVYINKLVAFQLSFKLDILVVGRHLGTL
jgi:hypothetical protein